MEIDVSQIKIIQIVEDYQKGHRCYVWCWGLEHKAHVLQESKSEVYNVVLGLVDILRGTNSYYKLQVLESDKSKKYVHIVCHVYFYQQWDCRFSFSFPVIFLISF